MLPMTLKLSDKVKIEGESLLKGYEKQIDIERLDHGITMPMVSDKSSNSRTSGRCKHEEFTCLMRMNKAYPKLVEACAKGSNLGNAELALVKMSEGKISEVAKYSLTDAYVSEVHLVSEPLPMGRTDASVVGDSTLPWIRFKLNYQSIAVTYNEYDSAGASKGAVSCDAITGLGA